MNNGFFREGRFCFDFSKSKLATKADLPSLNGLGGVDFIIELEDKFLFLEIKDIENEETPSKERIEWIEELEIKKNNLFLIKLGIKFKDTLIRKWANKEEFDKPIWYIIILQLSAIDAALRLKLAEDLSGWLPTCINEKYFAKKIAIKRREILDLKDWQSKFPEFPVEIINELSEN